MDLQSFFGGLFGKRCRVITIKFNEGTRYHIPQEKTLWRWRNCTIKAFDKDVGSKIEIPILFSEYQNAVDFLKADFEG